ncbi:MAG: ABC-F family ATP-binding cassette domain-containing protein [Candidatus Pacebacteria bacterium]|nr:ABC-F family ATP-binding cassette domain-containing protein [Candidatus Paceibacterota bacterium]
MTKYKIKLRSNSAPLKNPLLILSGVSKSFSNREIFSGVDLMVQQKDRIAIVGPNGTGKSALLKMIVGTVDCDEGSVDRNKNLKIGYLPQETNWGSLDNEIITEMKSADNEIFDLINKKKEYEHLVFETKDGDSEENVNKYEKVVQKYEKNKGYKYEISTEKILREFGFPEKDWKRTVRSLSGGERTRLALAKIVLCQPNILILDEPTNHLDLETIIWLENVLVDSDMTIIAVSHDEYFLNLVFDKTFELTKNGLEKYYCNYSGYLEEKKKRREGEEAIYKKQEKYLGKQQEFIDRFRAKATKAKAVQSRIKMLDKIEKVEKGEKDGKKIRIKFDEFPRLPHRVLEIEDLAFGKKDMPLATFKGKWEIEKEDKIGIIGQNGAGKSTLLKTLISKKEVTQGKIEFSNEVKVGYYAQAHEDLDPNKTILEEVESKTDDNENKVRSILGALLFSGQDVYKLISELSGGERARVAIAELILGHVNMLFLDEPTNHLDLESKSIIAGVLKNFNGPIMIVSHDRYILDEVCSVIWEIENGKVTKYLGNYSDHRQKKGKKG